MDNSGNSSPLEDITRPAISELLPLILESMSDAVLVIDREFRPVLFNKAAETLLGLPITGEGTVAEGLKRFGVLNADGVTPRTLDQTASARALAGQSVVGEQIFIRNPGVPAGRWINISASPLTNGKGEVSGAVIVFRDDTAGRQRTDLLVQESHARARFEAILVNTTDLVGIAEATGRPTYMNRAGRRMLQLSDDEDISQRHVADFHPTWAGVRLLKEAIPAAIKHGYWSGESALIRRDGSELPVSQVILAHHGPTRSVDFISTVIRDLTFLRQNEKNLTRISLMQQREDFMAMLTHDLKNPLIGSNRILELMAEGALGSVSPDQFRVLGQLRASNKSLLLMINNLIDTYKYERDLSAITRAPTDMRELIATCVTEMTAIADSRSINLSMELPARMELVDADAIAFRRVVQNLLDNALKFTPNGGEVLVRLSVDDEKIRLDVIDTGPGISPKDRKLLFQRFWRGSAEKLYAPGTGLGLYLCKQVVDAHAGRIFCTSNDSKGSIFSVEIPARSKP